MVDPRATHLTIGDALVVFVLLLFVCGWIGGWLYAFSRGPADSFDHLGSFAAFLLFLLVAGPPIWAAGLVRHVIENANSIGRSA